MSESYFVIYHGQGEPSVRQYTKEELLEVVRDEHYGAVDYLSSLSENQINYWGDNCMIIKGSIVTPKTKQVVTEYDVD